MPSFDEVIATANELALLHAVENRCPFYRAILASVWLLLFALARRMLLPP